MMAAGDNENVLEQLVSISATLNASFSEQELLSAILRRLVDDFGYRAATLRLLNPETQALELKAAFGLSAAYLGKGEVLVKDGSVDQAVLRGERVAIQDVRPDPRFLYGAAAGQEGLAGLLAVPLSLYQQVIGVMHVYTAAPRPFAPAEQAVVALVANLAAQGIQRARLFSSFRRIAQQVNSSLEVKSVLSALALEAVTAVGVKAAAIRLLGPRRATLHLVATYGLSQDYLDKGPVLVADSPIDQRVLKDGQPAAISELSAAAGWHYLEAAQREGIRSVLVVPLRVFETCVGILRLYSGRVREFSPEETSFAVAVAELGAVAIENAKLHESQQQRLEALKQDADGWYRFLALS
jgi:GAF domain-containing protein